MDATSIGFNGETVPINGISGEITVPEFDRHEEFTGEYIYTPTWTTQEIQTENKVLTSNIQIDPIQIREVSNEFGGITIFI